MFYFKSFSNHACDLPLVHYEISKENVSWNNSAFASKEDLASSPSLCLQTSFRCHALAALSVVWSDQPLFNEVLMAMNSNEDVIELPVEVKKLNEDSKVK